ncbi:MAG: hypothetical protein J1D85_08490 [Bacteroidales bacterium]|nr:hypothetical protein [Bacteroidales bacterium]
MNKFVRCWSCVAENDDAGEFCASDFSDDPVLSSGMERESIDFSDFFTRLYRFLAQPHFIFVSETLNVYES